jgi:non-heme chloroperoxidase
MLKNLEQPYSIPATVKSDLVHMHQAEYMEVEANVRLHIRDWGTGNPLVFIHGWPFSDELFEYQFGSLCRQGFRCIAISMRGFGKSDQPYGDYNYDVFADDFHKILCNLKLEKVTLVGFSMGAAIAIRYMARHMQAWVSSLVLVSSPSPIPASHKEEELVELCRKDRAQLVSNFINAFSSSSKALSPAMQEWLRSIALNASPYATLQSLIELQEADLRGDLDKITVPTAIFYGTKDAISLAETAKYLQEKIKNAHLVEFKNSGHGLILEEAAEFNRELALFAGEAEGNDLKLPG